GVVDQDVDAAETLGSRLDQFMAVIVAAHIGYDSVNATAVATSELVECSLQGGSVASADKSARALCQQGFGDAAADAARTAGHHSYFTLEFGGHSEFLLWSSDVRFSSCRKSGLETLRPGVHRVR